MFVQEALGLEGPVRHRLDRVLVERQGVRHGRAAAAPRAWSTRRSSAASTRCAAACCSASTRCSSSRPTPCRPFDAERDGISLGEAAGFALLERDAAPAARCTCSATASRATRTTCRRRTPKASAPSARSTTRWRAPASTPADIDHINLHGTASAKNDEVEAALVARRFPATTHASSTKGFTGHTLGAAGIVEAVASLLAIEHGLMPGTVNTRVRSTRPAGRRSADSPRAARCGVALSNSFGFGGNNCVLVFGKAARPSRARRADRSSSKASAFWAPTLPGWDAARAAFRGEGALAEPPAKRPRPQCCRRPSGAARPTPSRSRSRWRPPAWPLPAAQAADAALRVRLGARRPRRSTTTCARTLASAPTLLSPTKFHNSVHNAAAGYWTIGTGCMEASTR